MASSIFSPSFSPSKFPSTHRPRIRFSPASAKKNPSGSDFGSGFGLVDESMIVLRKRIHDMEVAERNYEPPSNWTQWEKEYYMRYGADICGFAGLVQAFLLSTRPGLGIGLMVLMAMSVPTSAAWVLVQLVHAVRTAGGFGG